MKDKKFLDKSQPFPVIRFPERIVARIFEDILIEGYKETLLKKTSQVEFDFSRVTWCDIFELSLISLWILELRERNKLVAFRYPLDKRCFQFLITYRFDTFLITQGVEREGVLPFGGAAAPTNLMRAPFFPLTFFSEPDLKDLLDDLSFGSRLEILLSEVRQAEIVKTGVIRDVILKELIDNIILHGGVRFAHLVMTKLGSSSTEDLTDWTRLMMANSSEIERNFFKSLRGKAFIVLVIGDKGIGINNSLKDAYSSDEILPQKRATPNDDDVLEYSFLYHSTRRTLEERLGEIKNVISEDASVYPPPTGLFRLKEKVRDFAGFLYVRSGSSVIAYDFFNHPELETPLYASHSKRKKIVNFGGTQYKLYFPVDLPHRSVAKKRLGSRWSHSANRPKYSQIIVRNHGSLDLFPSPEREATQLFSIFQELDRVSLANRDRMASIILDFQGETSLSAKAIHYLLFGAMQRQTSRLSIVAMNTAVDQAQWQAVFEKQLLSTADKRPLLVFDHNLNRYLFGVTASESAVVQRLLDEERCSAEDMETLTGKYDHLIEVDSIEESYHSFHTPLKLIEAARETTKINIATILLSPDTGIFNAEAKVLLPSATYCKGFFEVHKLISNGTSKGLLRNWFKYWLIELQADFVVSITRHLGKVVEEALGEIKNFYSGSMQHINLRTPASEVELVRLGLQVERDKRGVIVSEVMGSGDTLKRVLAQTQHANVVKILPIVNASEDCESAWDFKGKQYEVECALRYPLSYSPVLPQGWLYSEITQVDPSTHLLLVPAAELEGPLWKGISLARNSAHDEITETYENSFLDDCAVPIHGVVEGHFTNKDKHILHLFNIPMLVSHFGEDIANVITEHAKRSLASITPSKQLTHVMYLSRNPGVEILANVMSARFEKSMPISVGNDGRLASADGYPFQPMDVVMVIDDAIVSGDSIFRMYDIAEQKGASHVFAYVLIKRGSDDLARRYEKITQYGHLKIEARYLSDVEIPTYTSENCPACDRLAELESVHADFFDQPIYAQFLEDQINELTTHNVAHVESEQQVLSTAETLVPQNKSIIFRWKLELAKNKEKMAARKELHSVVRAHEEASEDALSLFQVIAKENSIFLRDDRIRRSIFYDSFANDVVTASYYFLQNLHALSDEDFESVLCVLLFLDQDFRVDDFLPIAQATITKPKMFLRLITQVLLRSIAYDYPGRTAKVFRTLNEELNDDSEFKPLIEQIIGYWVKEEEEYKALQNDRLAWFNSLSGGLLHEVGHFRDTIKGYLESGADAEHIAKSWLEFYELLCSAIPLLRNFAGHSVSVWLSGNLNSNITALELQVNEAKKLIGSLADESEARPNSEIQQLRTLIGKSVERIFMTINGPRGTRALLEKFTTNIKSVVFKVIQQQDEDLRRNGIQVIKEFPEESCTVFGEDTYVLQIFQNLIENVWKHSEATVLKIEGVIDYDDAFVRISVFDSGCGLPESFRFGDGLKLVSTNTRASCGGFDIKRVTDEEMEKFTTVATVNLPLVRGEPSK